MPTTVKQLFNHFGIDVIQQTPWGTCIFEKRQGIYVVSTSNVANENLGISDTPIFDKEQINLWIEKLQPNFKIDKQETTHDLLKQRLIDFWLPDENILYIGKADKRKKNTGIGVRIHEYFETEIGDRTPHSGGQWIKTLKDLSSCVVYYGLCENPKETEENMLRYFMENVSVKTRDRLHDKDLPLPFANIRLKSGKDKKHGMKKQRIIFKNLKQTPH